jgi:hypothetical protein
MTVVLVSMKAPRARGPKHRPRPGLGDSKLHYAQANRGVSDDWCESCPVSLDFGSLVEDGGLRLSEREPAPGSLQQC